MIDKTASEGNHGLLLSLTLDGWALGTSTVVSSLAFFFLQTCVHTRALHLRLPLQISNIHSPRHTSERSPEGPGDTV